MREFLFGLAEVTLSMSAVIALLLLGGRAWSKRFAPKWRYLAWLAVAVRLAVPLNLSLPKAPVTVEVPRAAVEASRVPVTEHKLIPVPKWGTLPGITDSTLSEEYVVFMDTVEPQQIKSSLESLLFAVWAAGAGVFLAVQFGGYGALRKKIRRWGRPDGAYEGLPVVVCPKTDSPMLVGFFRPVIVLPEGMGSAAREFALLHETTHFRRGDLWYKLLLVWCNAIHWFNPMVWALRRAAAGDVELSCDEALLRGRDEEYRRAYGTALVAQAAARTPGASLTSAFSGSKGSLKARVLALLDMAPKRSGRMALAAVCILALMGGTLVACRVAEPKRETVQAVAYRLEWDPSDEDAVPTAVDFLPMEFSDPVTGTGYYSVPEEWDWESLSTLPIAADATYTGFPDTMPNSDVKMHPGVVLEMKRVASSRFPSGFPVTLTVEDGVVVDLSPTENLFELTEGLKVSFLDGPADGNGMVRYENTVCGFALSIPEATAQRLAVMEYTDTPLISNDYQGPGTGTVTFLDRRLLGDKAMTLIQNRLGYAAAVICTPEALFPGGTESLGSNGTYWFSLKTGRMDRAELQRMTGVSDQVAAEIEADSTVMAGVKLEALEPKPPAPEDVRPERLTAVWMGPGEDDINWWCLELTASLTRPVFWERDSLKFSLEFEDDSPLLKLIGIRPFQPSSVDVNWETNQIKAAFITGRNTMTEQEFNRLTAGEPACTLVVTDPVTGAEKRFEMTVEGIGVNG